MENTEAPIQAEESPAIVESVAEETSKVNGELSDTKDLLKLNGEQTATDDGLKLNGAETTAEEVSSKSQEETSVEKKEEEMMPSTTLMTEQENVADTNGTMPPTCVSPGRANVPLKEVNESEKEEPTLISNGTDNTNSKKRELELEDELQEETSNDNDERSSEPTKKIKVTETSETPIMESKESEKSLIVNGNTAVEV